MDIRQLTPRYFVAPQLSPDLMAEYKAAGITRILCNRPDEEVPPALSAAALQAAAQAEGLEFVVQPLTHATMTEQNVIRNREIGADQDGVTLAYCASGGAHGRLRSGKHAWFPGTARPLIALRRGNPDTTTPLAFDL